MHAYPKARTIHLVSHYLNTHREKALTIRERDPAATPRRAAPAPNTPSVDSTPARRFDLVHAAKMLPVAIRAGFLRDAQAVFHDARPVDDPWVPRTSKNTLLLRDRHSSCHSSCHSAVAMAKYGRVYTACRAVVAPGAYSRRTRLAIK